MVLGLSLLVTLVAAFATDALIRRERQTRFEGQAQAELVRVQHRMDAYILLLESGRTLMSETGFDRDLFRDLAAQLFAQAYPGVQGIGYAIRVAPGQSAAIEEQGRQSGIPEFHVWPSTASPESFPIFFLEPMDARNRAALGYDMYSDAVRREAMDRARDSGEAACSARVTLVQEIEGPVQPGFLIYVPVYSGGSIPKTVAERRDRLVGFIYSPFRAGDLFRALFGAATSVEHSKVAVTLYDGPPAPDSLLFEERPRAQQRAPRGQEAIRTVDVAGRRWTLVVKEISPEVTGFQPWLPYVVLAAGALFTLVIFALATAQMRAHQGAERQRAMAESLARSGLALSSELTTEEIVQRLVEEGTRLTFAAAGAYFPRAAPGERPQTVAMVRREPDKRLDTAALRPLVTRVLLGESLREEDLRDSRVIDDESAALTAGMVSVLGVPVRSRAGQTLGGLLFVHPDKAHFRPEHVQLLAGLAAQAAVALDNARLYREARDAIREREEFMSVATHELRAPLTTLTLRLDQLDSLMRAGAPPERLHGAVESARVVLHRLGRLISDLLDVARIGGGRLLLERKRMDFSDLVLEVVQRLEPHTERAASRIHVAASPVHGFWDATRLDQVVTNLLDNALKYGADQPVEVMLREEDGWAVLEVVDHGIGIPPEKQPRLFNRFERAVSDKQYAGLGLGLYITKEIVELHGGRISVDSHPGETRFTVRLPCNIAPREERPLDSTEQPPVQH